MTEQELAEIRGLFRKPLYFDVHHDEIEKSIKEAFDIAALRFSDALMAPDREPNWEELLSLRTRLRAWEFIVHQILNDEYLAEKVQTLLNRVETGIGQLRRLRGTRPDSPPAPAPPAHVPEGPDLEAQDVPASPHIDHSEYIDTLDKLRMALSLAHLGYEQGNMKREEYIARLNRLWNEGTALYDQPGYAAVATLISQHMVQAYKPERGGVPEPITHDPILAELWADMILADGMFDDRSMAFGAWRDCMFHLLEVSKTRFAGKRDQQRKEFQERLVTRLTWPADHARQHVAGVGARMREERA